MNYDDKFSAGISFRNRKGDQVSFVLHSNKEVEADGLIVSTKSTSGELVPVNAMERASMDDLERKYLDALVEMIDKVNAKYD